MLLFFFSYSLSAQNSAFKPQIWDELVASQEETSVLYRARYLSATLYRGTGAWIFLQGDLENKKQLRHNLFIGFPQVKNQLGASSARENMKKFTVKFENFVKQSQSIIGLLMTFEDYENETKVSAAREKFVYDFTALYNELLVQTELLLNEIRNKREKVKISLAASDLNTKSANQTAWKEIWCHFSMLDSLQSARQVNSDIFTGTFKWIYLSNDLKSKSVVNYLLKKKLSFITAFLTGNTGKCIPSFMEMRFLAVAQGLDSLQESVLLATSLLRVEADYEDPTIKFMAEAALEDEIGLLFNSGDQELTALIDELTERTKGMLADPQGKAMTDKKEIIRKIILTNRASIVLMIAQINASSARKISIDDVMEELIPVYDRRFSLEELNQIYDFQASPTGQKLQNEALAMMLDISDILKAMTK